MRVAALKTLSNSNRLSVSSPPPVSEIRQQQCLPGRCFSQASPERDSTVGYMLTLWVSTFVCISHALCWCTPSCFTYRNTQIRIGMQHTYTHILFSRLESNWTPILFLRNISTHNTISSTFTSQTHTHTQTVHQQLRPHLLLFLQIWC